MKREETIERLAYLKRLWEYPTYSRKNVMVCVVAHQGMHSSEELLKEAWGDEEEGVGDKVALLPMRCLSSCRMGYLSTLKCVMDEHEGDLAGWMKKFRRSGTFGSEETPFTFTGMPLTRKPVPIRSKVGRN